MKINETKKLSIILYMLEKIEENTASLSKCVAEAFDMGQSTVHLYLNELVEKGVIRKMGRGKYELVTQATVREFRRSRGEISSDTYAYETMLADYMRALPNNVKRIWEYAFTEMVNNVMDHSEAECMRVTVSQNYLRTTVMIEDNGVGIFEKIKKHFSLPSLEEAICELFKGKLTTDAENHSGEGIFFSSKMMDDFAIFSGQRVFSATKYERDTVFLLKNEIPGTAVCMSLSNFSHKTAREVFDLYANVEGGFTKTRIPLKNVFETAPVSRSQAKRVCNRLEQFKEVVLDFEGIEWMGQGFAHQLFVVFAKAHPDVTFTVLHMNEEVARMHRHVTASAE